MPRSSTASVPHLPLEIISNICDQANGLRVLHVAACTSRAWHGAADQTRRSWKLLAYVGSRAREAGTPKARYPCAMIQRHDQPVTAFVMAEDQWLITCTHSTHQRGLFSTVRLPHAPPRLRGSDGPSGIVLYTPKSGPQKLFVSDAGRDVVCVFATRGGGPLVFNGEFGGFGSDGGNLISPGDLCIVEHSGQSLLYVAEAHAVSVFALPEAMSTSSSPLPTFVCKFGSRGGAPGEFRKGVGGLAASPHDLEGKARLFACDTGNHRVQAFTAHGTLVRTFGRKGEAAGEFNKPAAIAIVMNHHAGRSIHGAARVIVGETVGKRIQVLSAVGAPLQLISTLPAPPAPPPPPQREIHGEREEDSPPPPPQRETIKARVACFAYDEHGDCYTPGIPLLHAASASSDAVLHTFGVLLAGDQRPRLRMVR